MKNNSKLLLTSSGLVTPALVDCFASLTGRPLGSVKSLFVPTAGDLEVDRGFVADARRELRALSAEVADLDFKVSSPEFVSKALETHDVLYVNGGNTFYLLYWALQARLFEALRGFFLRGGVYVGVSAGSILAGPTIETAGWKGCDDPSVVELASLNAGHLVPFYIFPHYSAKWESVVSESQPTLAGELVTLRDGEAIAIDGTERWFLRGESACA